MTTLQQEVYRNLVMEFPIKQGATDRERRAYERTMRSASIRIARRLKRWAKETGDDGYAHA